MKMGDFVADMFAAFFGIDLLMIFYVVKIEFVYFFGMFCVVL